MRKFTLIPAALLLAGCSAPAESTPTVIEDTFTPSPVQSYSTADPFDFYTDEALGTIQFGAEPLPLFNEYMAAIGNTDEFSFATVDVDNRNGTTPIDSIGALAYTEEGVQHECTHVNNILNDHVDEEPVTDEALDLYYELDGVYEVSAGQRATVHLVCAGTTPETVASATFRTMGTEWPAFQEEETK